MHNGNRFSGASPRTSHDTEQREARVLGDGPRIQALGVAHLTDELLQIMVRMSQINSLIKSRDRPSLTDAITQDRGEMSQTEMAERLTNLPEIMRTMLRHPHLFALQADVGIQLLGRGALSARDREMAILRIGWLCQAPYEWGEHVLIAKKVGITSEDIERITQGSAAAGWDDHERAILKAVEELYDEAMISDATWATLAQRLDERQLIELPILIGQYQGVAYYQNSLRLRLHEGNLGLKAR
jgi:alkylhydroperoxidase family enzyme